MSKVTIAGDVNGSGVFTIAAPNGNTNRTLTLPDEAGTVLTSFSDLVATKLTGALPASVVPSGGVIAMSTVRSSTRTSMPTTSNYVAFSGSFTKQRTDSVIIATSTVFGNSFNSGNCGVGLKLDSTWDFGSSYQYDGAWSGPLQTTIVIGTGRWEGFAAGSHTMGWGWSPADGSNQQPFAFLNPNTASGELRNNQLISSIVIFEVAL